MPVTKRAYSDEAKQQREQKIILAAEALLMEKGYYAINMDQVARAAGLAKGTVYLYFKTKEELFLKVFERQAQFWFDKIERALSAPGMDASPAAMIDLLIKTLVENPLLTRLVALSTVIFEYNISLERAREHKLWIFNHLGVIGARMDDLLHLRPAQGVQFLFRIFIVVAGLEGFAHPSPVTKQVVDSEPGLEKIDFETELRHLLPLIFKSAGESG